MDTSAAIGGVCGPIFVAAKLIRFRWYMALIYHLQKGKVQTPGRASSRVQPYFRARVRPGRDPNVGSTPAPSEGGSAASCIGISGQKTSCWCAATGGDFVRCWTSG